MLRHEGLVVLGFDSIGNGEFFGLMLEHLNHNTNWRSRATRRSRSRFSRDHERRGCAALQMLSINPRKPEHSF
jgi:hypothetical protein